MTVKNVGRLSVCVQVLLVIGEFILVQNLLNVKNVGRPLDFIHNLVSISVFILVRNLINVTCMVIALVSVQPSQRIHTGEKPC